MRKQSSLSLTFLILIKICYSQNTITTDSLLKLHPRISKENLRNRIVVFTSDNSCKTCFNQIRKLSINFKRKTKQKALIVMKCFPDFMYQKEVIHKYGLDDSLLYEVVFEDYIIKSNESASLVLNSFESEISIAFVNKFQVTIILNVFEDNKLKKEKMKLLHQIEENFYRIIRQMK